MSEVEKIAKVQPSCWLCGEIGHRPAPVCQRRYMVRQALAVRRHLENPS